MNWETAKRWLIVLFLVLDGMLGWQLHSSRQLMNGYVESESDLLANTKTLLAAHGLTLSVDIPTKQPDMASFQGQAATPSLSALVQAVFQHPTNVHLSIASDQATTDQGQVSVLPDNSFEVTFAKSKPIGTKHAPKSYAYQSDAYILDDVSSTRQQMVFLQVYKDYPIFDARIVTSQTKTAISSFTQTEIASIQQTSSPRPVISALDALDSLANSVDKSNGAGDNKILKVEIGYARKVPLYQTGDTANYWFPVWRIVTQSQTYYVNAFTGEVEIAP